MKKLGLQFCRFLLVGGVCIVLNLLALYGLTDLLGLHYLLSCCVAVVLVNYVGFRLNKALTFTDAAPGPVARSVWQFLKYNAVSVVSFLLVIGQMYVLVDIFGFWYIHANIIAGIVMAFVNFAMHKHFTYAHRPVCQDS